MLRKLFSCATVLLISAAAPAMAQTYSSSPAHEAEVERGAPVADALNLLEAAGYASFTNFQQVGDKFEADAIKDGQAKHVVIDLTTRQVAAVGPAQSGPQTQSGAAR
jgi:hypothetical protein